MASGLQELHQTRLGLAAASTQLEVQQSASVLIYLLSTLATGTVPRRAFVSKITINYNAPSFILGCLLRPRGARFRTCTQRCISRHVRACLLLIKNGCIMAPTAGEAARLWGVSVWLSVCLRLFRRFTVGAGCRVGRKHVSRRSRAGEGLGRMHLQQ